MKFNVLLSTASTVSTNQTFLRGLKRHFDEDVNQNTECRLWLVQTNSLKRSQRMVSSHVKTRNLISISDSTVCIYPVCLWLETTGRVLTLLVNNDVHTNHVTAYNSMIGWRLCNALHQSDNAWVTSTRLSASTNGVRVFDLHLGFVGSSVRATRTQVYMYSYLK